MLSVCMIVRNEARNIVSAILCARKIADEIVVIDTGSTDNTRQLLDTIGQKYECVEWRDSFAAARNQSIERATMPWIFWMDADDNITDDAAMRINALKQKPADSVFLFNVTLTQTQMDDTIGNSKTFMQLRMFPNKKGLSFVGRVHEQVAGDALLKLNRLYAEDITVEHHGYSEKAHQVESLRRNIRLQMIELGFPENRDFFSFEIGPDIFCIYHPQSMAVWYKKTMLTTFDPFSQNKPDTHDACLAEMVRMAKIYLQSHLDGLRVSAKESLADWVLDIETALRAGVVRVCCLS